MVYVVYIDVGKKSNLGSNIKRENKIMGYEYFRKAIYMYYIYNCIYIYTFDMYSI